MGRNDAGEDRDPAGDRKSEGAMTQTGQAARRRRLEDSAARRILVLDGAMGTMIQAHGLDEADYRGDRFANHRRELRGDNDLLNLTRPEVIEAIHDRYLEAGADIVSTNTFNATAISQTEYDLADFAYELNRAAALGGRRARPHRPHGVHLAGRQRSRVPQRHLRRVADGLWGSGTGPAGRRRRSAAGRDGVRHFERARGALRDRRAPGGARRNG